jgi:EpsI family protein
MSFAGLLLLAIAIALYSAYSDTFSELEYYWVEGYNWQFLIPIAFIYMVWERRELFYRLEYKPSVVIGGTLLALSCMLLIAGQVSSTHALRELSIVATMFALSVMLMGVEPTRKLFWPLAYLVLMTSLPTVALIKLETPLAVLSARVSADILQFFGYAIYREGSFLYLPHITLEVANECSGVNQLTSSIALGIPIAFTILNKWWKRIFIILVSCAFGIIMNWVRVILISLWHYNSAKQDEIHGPHDIYGLPFIFMIGVFLTLVIAFAIAEKRSAQSQASSGSNPESRPSPLASIFAAPRFHTAAITGFAVLALTAVYLNTWTAKPVKLLIAPGDFPLSLAGFNGKRIDKLEKPFYSGLADDEIIATYTNPVGESALVYIGHFRSQDQERELVDYRYNWLQEGAKPVELEVGSRPVHMKRKVVKTREGARAVYFYYDINGRDIVDPKRAKLASLVDAIVEHRNNGTIVIVMFDTADKTLSSDQRRFLGAVVNEVRKIVPE